MAASLGVLGVAAGAAAQEARARTPARIGRLSPLSAEADRLNMEAFRKGLTDLGWVEGKSFTIESRFAAGQLDRLPGLATELARERLDLIITGSDPGVLAAKKATSSIPIVMVTTGDPVAGGLVTSLARPGANVTGVTALGQVLTAKRLELLKEAVPGVARIAVLVNPKLSYTAVFLKERDATSRTLGLELPVFEASEADALEAAFTEMTKARAGALMVQIDPWFITHRQRIVRLAAMSRLPAVYGESEFVEAGGLMFYGASLVGMYREAAVYADKILKGAKPETLPVEQPTKLDLVINLKAAKAMGITIPRSVLVRADRVLE